VVACARGSVYFRFPGGKEELATEVTLLHAAGVIAHLNRAAGATSTAAELKLISEKAADLYTRAPSATRTRDLLLRRHFPSVAWRRLVSPDVGSGRSENRWT
jgi:hypothetical protein